MTFRSSILAELNQGVVTSLFSLNSVFMAIIGTFMFHEKMHFNHYLGIILLMVCSVLISFSDDPSKKDAFEVLGNTVSKGSPVVAVIFAVLCPLGFATVDTLTRVVMLQLRYPARDFKTASYFLQGIAMVIVNLFIVPGHNLPFDIYV